MYFRPTTRSLLHTTASAEVVQLVEKIGCLSKDDPVGEFTRVVGPIRRLMIRI
ncbi:hypothetical protein [Spirosoma endophyticum]|uniref:hypothetical protein n=1 Tax=Spirosoma endophyticum TaxID=662367 RepID=UPI0015A62652|nr:hypothetical protein [Spirosoma endophyticum]